MKRVLGFLKGLLANSYLKICLVIAAIAIVGLSTVGDYGISADEKIGIEMVYWNRDLVLKGKPIPGLFKYDGTIFNFFSEAVFQASKPFYLAQNKTQREQKGIERNRQFIDRIKLKHILTFLSSLIAYFSVAGFVAILSGVEYSWLGPISLALLPRFWGHSFFNFKDVPFASLFILSSLLGACLVESYLSLDTRLKLGLNKIIFFSFFYGVLIGLLTGIRFGGCFILSFVPIIYFLLIILDRQKRTLNLFQYFFNFCIFFSCIFLGWLITTILIYPVSWSNPIGWIFEIFSALSKYGWSGTVLFQGQWIPAQSLPWFYLPMWILITTPLIFQIGAFGGVAIAFIKFYRFSRLQRICIILLLLQAFLIPTMAIVRRSTMYDEMRHFLFILPVIAVFSASFMIEIFKLIRHQKLRLLLLTSILVIFASIAADAKKLHPYEYIYFNRISGGLERAYNYYETDYWGLSMKEAMAWLNHQAKPGAKVIVGGYLHSVSPFSRPDIQLIHFSKAKNIELEKPYYYLARPRWDLPNKFPECQLIYQVKRQNVPLSIVKQCD